MKNLLKTFFETGVKCTLCKKPIEDIDPPIIRYETQDGVFEMIICEKCSDLLDRAAADQITKKVK